MKEILEIRNAFHDASLIKTASSVMTDTAKWLIEKGDPMWSPAILTPAKLKQSYDPSEIHVGFINHDPCAAFVLQWHDDELWPNAKHGEAGYIHKLSILPSQKGQIR